MRCAGFPCCLGKILNINALAGRQQAESSLVQFLVHRLASSVDVLHVMSVAVLKCEVCNHSLIIARNPAYHLVFTRCHRGKGCAHNDVSVQGYSDSGAVGCTRRFV